MTAANPHRIGRQVLELELASAAGAAALQEEAARPLRGGAPEIEALFDRLAGPDEILRIERLEIDLGELRGAGWREQLLARLVERLRAALEPRAGRPAAGEREEEAPPARSSPADARFEQFLFFLARGRLPWWGRRPERPWREAAPAPRNAVQRRSLGELLRADPRARQRLVLTVDDAYLAARVVELAGLAGSERALQALAPAASTGERRRRWRRRFWLAILELAAGEGPAAGRRGVQLVRRLLESAPPVLRPGESAPDTARDRPVDDAAPAPEPQLPEPWRSWLETAREEALAAAEVKAGEADSAAPPVAAAADSEPALERPEEAAGEAPPAGPAPPEPRAEGAPASSAGATGADASAAEGIAPPAAPAEPTARAEALLRFPEPAAGPPAESATERALWVDGSGVVILHPFLEELFAGRGLLEERRFRDEAARRRAVRLLAQLTFGVADLPEYELLVPKLLCAMAWEEPLEPVELEADDFAACDELLAAVLGHWTALKSASPAWLREQFFLRDGRLEPVDDGWKLTVEHRAQDVLLSRLPWGVGMIHLPWMQELLYVSWAE